MHDTLDQELGKGLLIMTEALDLIFTGLFFCTGADRDVSGAAGFLTSLFTEHLTSPAKPLYHHYTTATDTSCIRDIFQTVMDNVVKDNLANVCTL